MPYHVETCGLLYRQWKARLENEPEPYFIRCVREPIVWRNKAAQQSLNLLEEEPWENVEAHLDDAAVVNDAHSMAVKTGQIVRHTTEFRDNVLEMTYAADYCPKCEKKCALVIAFCSVAALRAAFFSLHFFE